MAVIRACGGGGDGGPGNSVGHRMREAGRNAPCRQVSPRVLREAGGGLLNWAGTRVPTHLGAPNGMRKDLTIKNIKHLLYHLPQKVHVRAMFQGRSWDVPAATLTPRHLLEVLCLWLLPWGPSCGTQTMRSCSKNSSYLLTLPCAEPCRQAPNMECK